MTPQAAPDGLTFDQARQRGSYVRRMCDDEIRKLKAPGEKPQLIVYGPSWFPRDGRVIPGWLVAVILTDAQAQVTPVTILVSGLMPTAGRFAAAVSDALTAARKLAQQDKEK